jgi:tetrapyrrole methylase family protein/MazG family protein
MWLSEYFVSMATLTILGLGPGDAHYLTAEAVAHLQEISEVWLRTRIHPTVQQLPSHLTIQSFDPFYETASDWASMYRQIAEALIERVAGGEAITYAVPGHPLMAEATVRHIKALAQEQNIAVRIIAGLSFVEPVCEALNLDPLQHGLQLTDALEFLASSHFPEATKPSDRAWSELQGVGPYVPPLVPFPVSPTKPVLVCQVYHPRVASALKLGLLARYPANHPVTIVTAAGVADQTYTRTVELYELDHNMPFDHLTVVYVPPLAVHEDVRSMDVLEWVVVRLLGPIGCPWDREQTHRSLRPYLLEEAHEVLEALDAEDPDLLSEELGDLLLQIVMHSEMARQAGDFDFGDILNHIVSKLIRRHPHVFGEILVSDSADVLRNWEEIKAQERANKGVQRGLLDGIPVSLPALAAAQKIGNKAAKVGFDWPDVGSVWDKVREEIDELQQAEPQQRSEEFGDLLFVLARIASWLDVDAETALREANVKFKRRFAACERLAAGQNWNDLSPAQLDALWEQAKREEYRAASAPASNMSLAQQDERENS